MIELQVAWNAVEVPFCICCTATAIGVTRWIIVPESTVDRFGDSAPHTCSKSMPVAFVTLGVSAFGRITSRRHSCHIRIVEGTRQREAMLNAGLATARQSINMSFDSREHVMMSVYTRVCGWTGV
jgi:hypothetical protein